MVPARTVFFGSGPFALALLDAIAAEPALEVAAVVTSPPRPAGRGGITARTPVHARALDLDLPVLVPERLRDPAFLGALDGLGPDVGVLADYGKLLPPSVLDRPRHGILNLHPSLLPRHRGATPVPAAILAGDAETGVTLFLMDVGLDTGPVVAVERLQVEAGEDAPHLEARLAVVAAGVLRRAIGPYLRGDLPAVPQAEDGVSMTRPLQRGDGLLDPALPAAALERRVRAMRPWPGTYVDLPDGRLAVLRASIASGDDLDAHGTLVAAGRGLALVTARERLVLDEVRPAGGRPMDGAAFRRGHPGVVGARAGTRELAGTGELEATR